MLATRERGDELECMCLYNPEHRYQDDSANMPAS
jgi:hypothetical protein